MVTANRGARVVVGGGLAHASRVQFGRGGAGHGVERHQVDDGETARDERGRCGQRAQHHAQDLDRVDEEVFLHAGVFLAEAAHQDHTQDSGQQDLEDIWMRS